MLLSESDVAKAFVIEDLVKGVYLNYSCQEYWIMGQYFKIGSPESSLSNSNMTGLSFYTFS